MPLNPEGVCFGLLIPCWAFNTVFGLFVSCSTQRQLPELATLLAIACSTVAESAVYSLGDRGATGERSEENPDDS